MSKNICTVNELDLFEKPNIQASILSFKYHSITPAVDYKSGDLPMYFKVGVSNNEYIDLTNIYLYVKCSIVKKSNTSTKLQTSDNVGPINNLLHSLFSQVEVFLNHKSITTTTNYPYKAYFENTLNFGHESKNTHLSSEFYFKDTAYEFNSTKLTRSITTKIERNPESAEQTTQATETFNARETVIEDQSSVQEEDVMEQDNNNASILDKKIINYVDAANQSVNEGFKMRRSFFIGKSVEMYGKLHLDIFTTNKYLPNNVELDIKLTKNLDSFLLMGANAAEFKVVISEIAFEVKKVELDSSVILAHKEVLEKGNYMRFPFTRVVVDSHLVNSGSQSVKLEDLCPVQICKRMIISLVKQSGFEGSNNNNPFYFEHFNCQNISLTLDGNNIPYLPFEFDFDKNQFLRGYYTLFTGTGNTMDGNGITTDDYKKGFMMLCLDLSRDGCSIDDHRSLTRRGNLKLKIKFGSPLSESINVIIYYEYDDEFQIAKFNNIIYEQK